MNGSNLQTLRRSIGGSTYTLDIAQDERGISIIVSVPGTARHEKSDRTFASLDEALVAADAMAGSLIRRQPQATR